MELKVKPCVPFPFKAPTTFYFFSRVITGKVAKKGYTHIVYFGKSERDREKSVRDQINEQAEKRKQKLQPTKLLEVAEPEKKLKRFVWLFGTLFLVTFLPLLLPITCNL